MRKLLFILSTLTVCAGYADVDPDDKVIWSCKTSNPYSSPILHLVEWGNRSYVKFSYMRFSALLKSDEEQRGWYWHNDGSGYYRYGIILGHDGKAWYHRFSASEGEPSQPLDYFVCSADD